MEQKEEPPLRGHLHNLTDALPYRSGRFQAVAGPLLYLNPT